MDKFLPDPNYETRLRALAQELAAGIQEPPDILQQLGFDHEDYARISSERVFKELLASAVAEWNAAGSTQKRAKLKAAVAVENTIHHLARAIANPEEPLSSRTGAYLALLKTGGMGNPEPVSGYGGGSMFKLEIHMATGRREELVMGITPESVDAIESQPKYTQSALLDGRAWEQLG